MSITFTAWQLIGQDAIITGGSFLLGWMAKQYIMAGVIKKMTEGSRYAVAEQQKAHDNAHMILGDTAKHYRELGERMKFLRAFLADKFPNELNFAVTMNWDIFELTVKILSGWKAPSLYGGGEKT